MSCYIAPFATRLCVPIYTSTLTGVGALTRFNRLRSITGSCRESQTSRFQSVVSREVLAAAIHVNPTTGTLALTKHRTASDDLFTILVTNERSSKKRIAIFSMRKQEL